jgi:hypothetical protein
MTQVVSCQPFTAEAQVHVRVAPCEICDGESGTGIGFSLSSYRSTMAVHTHISSWGGEQYAFWWLQFRDMVFPLQHEQHEQ